MLLFINKNKSSRLCSHILRLLLIELMRHNIFAIDIHRFARFGEATEV